MKGHTIQKLRRRLLEAQDETRGQMARAASDRAALEDRAIEPLDEAQREEMTRMLHKLEAREQAEIKEINLALDRMMEGTYGICEICRKPIAFKRLAAIPTARMCLDCAKKYERFQKARRHLRDEIINDDRVESYRLLEGEQVA